MNSKVRIVELTKESIIVSPSSTLSFHLLKLILFFKF